MSSILAIYTFISVNGSAIMGALFALWGFAEFVVRLTPTKKDDTALERVGKVLKAGMDALGIPNRRVVEVEIKGKSEEPKPEEPKAS